MSLEIHVNVIGGGDQLPDGPDPAEDPGRVVRLPSTKKLSRGSPPHPGVMGRVSVATHAKVFLLHMLLSGSVYLQRRF